MTHKPIIRRNSRAPEDVTTPPNPTDTDKMPRIEMNAISRRGALSGIAAATAFGSKANSAVNFGIIGTGERGRVVGNLFLVIEAAVVLLIVVLPLLTREMMLATLGSCRSDRQ